MKPFLLSAIPTFIMLLSACAGKHDSVTDGADTVLTEITRFDLDAAAYPGLDSAGKREFAARYAEVLPIVLGNLTVSDSGINAYATGRGVTVFTPDIEKRFTAADSIGRVLSTVTGRLKRMLPSMKRYDIYGAVSTYNQSIIMTDSVMVVGLNHYLGEDYPGYGYFEPYQRRVKTQAHIAYDIAEASVAGSYPYMQQPDGTLLNRMLYDGALIYVIMVSMPEADIAEAMGFTPIQARWMEENEGNVWRRIIENEYLYSTDPLTIDKIMRPAPSTPSIHPEAPGRAGRYIGYHIVEAYMKSHSLTEPEKLLSPEFYNSEKSLIDAGYKP